MNRSGVIACFMAVAMAWPAPTLAYDLLTHEAINVGAVFQSTLDARLRQELNVRDGVEETIENKRVIDWIREGGAREDTLPRPLNHFHNPLRSPWRNAGLRDLPFSGLSSILWGQDANQGSSWINARESYLSALTLAGGKERQKAFADAFRSLGQVMHLVADASVPAHVRNDSHAAGEPYERWVEDQAASRLGEDEREARERFLNDFIARAMRPDDSFTLGLAIRGQDAADAPVPIARLWDTDRYLGSNPSVTLSPQIGITEYANANFFSRDTVFADQKSAEDKHHFTFPSSADVEPYMDPTNSRKYWRKRAATQDEPRHLATVSKRFFWQGSSGVELQKRGGLDEKVHEDYARLLLPRAVGYAAALLDYFFRGTLDVDLVAPDSDNPSLFQLIGTNGSSDTLVEGRLTLYSDEPSGIRGQVPGFMPIALTGVKSGEPLFSLPPSFQPPENAERFVAVYQGTLGLEKEEGNFLGGVIGKVLGGVRVEEIFSDGVRWKLRTPKGVFLLQGLMAAEFEEVRWGDGDNLLVARTPFGAGQPNQVVAYEVQRLPNSVELVTVVTPDGLEAQLARKSEAVFPFGVSLGTVNFSHTIQYRQQIAIYQPRRAVFVLKAPDANFPDFKVCTFDHFELGTPVVKTVAARDVVFQGSFPLTLDLARNGIFGTTNQPYVWQLREVGATATGRLLGLVRADLTYPEGDGVSVPVIALNRDTGAEEVVFELGFSPTFPPAVGSPLWALVDLKTAEVVASTAEPVLTIAGEEAFEGFPDVWAHAETVLCDQTLSAWVKLPFAQTHPGDIVQTDAAAQTRNGLFGLTVTGWLKDELNGLAVNRQLLFGVQLATLQEDSGGIIYDCIPSGEISVCRFMRVSSTTGFFARGPAGLDEVRRARPAPGSERLVFLARAGTGTATPVATVVVWDPTARRAQIRHEFLEDFPELGPATGGTLLASTLFPGGGEGALVPRAGFLISLEGAQGPTDFPGLDLRESFTLLEPGYLYSVRDLKFFRSKPPLQPTALPAKLADLPDKSNPVGDYHAIRVP